MIIKTEGKYVVTVIDPETDVRYYGDRTTSKSWARNWANQNKERDGLDWDIVKVDDNIIDYWLQHEMAFECPHCGGIHGLNYDDLVNSKVVITCEKCNNAFTLINDGDSIFIMKGE